VLAALAHPQDSAVKQRANRYIEEVNRQAGSDALYLIDLQGLTLAASNWATPQTFVGESYANRPYFIDARAGRNGLFYGVGQTTGEPGLFISAPVRPDGGAVLGVVTVKVSLRQLQDAYGVDRLTDGSRFKQGVNRHLPVFLFVGIPIPFGPHNLVIVNNCHT